MKIKINNIVWVLMLLIISACSDDFLQDKKNYDDTDDSFYESETRVNWYMANIFYNCYNGWNSPTEVLMGAYTDMYSKMTEELGGLQTYISPKNKYYSSDYGSGYYGTKLADKIQNNPYTRIRNCTELITTIDEKGTSLDSDFRTHAKGQMYYIRALQYFELMRVYGGVPIVTEVEAASSEDETIKHPRASVPDVVAQIVEDLDSAAAMLPSTWGASDYGRYTKGAALAQKSKVLLTFASPLFNTDWDNTGNTRWKNALEAGLAAETELSSAGFGLYGSSAKDWEDMFNIDNSSCSEAISVQLFGSGSSNVTINNSWENNIRLSSQDGNGGIPAPKEMIDLFPMSDGSRPTTENNYDEELFFLNRDPRFYRTFAFSGCKWAYKEDEESTVWAYRYQYKDGEDTTTVSSDGNSVTSLAFVRKMTNVSESNENGFAYSGKDIFVYRYAELLLNIAECYAATGNTGKCLEYLGRIRNRVGIPSTNNYGIGTLSDKYAAIEACLYERRVELAYEGKRYWDIQRWMLYNDDTDYNNSTCQKLGIETINGTQRTGGYLTYKKGLTSSAVDPLDGIRDTISVDPDNSDFLNELQILATFYEDNFTREELETPMDNVDGKAAQILFQSNYYIMGLNTSILTQNTWLKQTIGWEDASGAAGTYDYQAE